MNAAGFEPFVEFCAALGVQSIHVCTFTPQGRGKINKSRLQLDQARLNHLQLSIDRLSNSIQIMGGLPEMLDVDRVGYRWDCCPLGGSIRIGPDGSIFPCELAAEQAFVVGNIRTSSIASSLASNKGRVFRDNSRERISGIEECRICLWRHFCGGGCMVLSYAAYGELNRTDYYCSLRKKWFPTVLWREFDKRQGANQL